MSKERKTVSVDPEVAAYLDTDGRNASATVNRLVKLDMGGSAINEELIRMRMDAEKDKYHDAAQNAKRHLERYNELKDRLEEAEQERQDEVSNTIEEAAEILKPSEWLSSIPKEENIPPADSEQVQELAEETDLTPEELRDAVVDHILTQEGYDDGS